MFAGITQDQLEQALMRVMPTSLLGLELYRQHQPQPGDLPLALQLDPQPLNQAIAEMRGYQHRCAKLQARLYSLNARPITLPGINEDFVP